MNIVEIVISLPPAGESNQSRRLVRKCRVATSDIDDNIGTHGAKIVEKAKLVPWEKLFQNCRASRETELMGEYPNKDGSQWLGNSVPVAMKHYAMSRDEVFERASQNGVKKSGAESGAVCDGTELHDVTEDA
jgi:hypothetical protein